MRAPSTPVLLAIAAAGLAVAGCASQPKEDETSRTVNKPACTDDAANPLHLTTLRKEIPRDPELESLLNQSNDPRLLRINREMYQTLRTLDAELRRQQQMAACERGDSDIQPLQAQSTPNSGNGNGNGVGSAGSSGSGAVAAGGPNTVGGGVGGAGVGTSAGALAGGGGSSGGGYAASDPIVANVEAAPSAATSSAGLAASGAGSAAAARTTLIRKSSVPPTTSGGGGNGATAQKVSPGSDNDIVARRLRKAAEQETDPAVKAKLWKEYAQYSQGSTAK